MRTAFAPREQSSASISSNVNIPSSRMKSHRVPFILLNAILFSSAVQPALGELFVTNPISSTTCTGGQPCTVEWLDNGVAPLLNEIGASTVALYDQEKTLVQQLSGSVDVSTTRSFNFTANPAAGPNSNTYYVQFTSLAAKNPNDTDQPYVQYSARFRMTGMTGSNSPVSSLVQPIATVFPTAAPGSQTNGSGSSTGGTQSSGSLPLYFSSVASNSSATLTSPGASATSSSTSSSTASASNLANAAPRRMSEAPLLSLAAYVFAALFFCHIL